ncbi:MAG: hypothetical protein WEA61_02590 [Anaerolineales bacterium]
MPSREKWLVGGILLLFILLITVPYIYANSATDSEHTFSGFLLNPIDGHSYLAKMRQGFEGSWQFTLPYTADPGEGVASNLYYLFLGHVARVSDLSLVFIFHAARVLGALLLGLALYRLFFKVLVDPETKLFALALALFGSGLGWLAIWFGFFSSDFWVAEAFPYLASYANAHFPLGLALQVWLLAQALEIGVGWQRRATTALLAFLLAVIFPFGWLIVVVVSGTWLLWQRWRQEPAGAEWTHWLAVTAGGAPYAAYALWVINTHPILSQWNAQNLTPASGLLDLFVAFSPALALAGWGAIFAFHKGTSPSRLLAIWLLVGIILIYVPFGLQRRLISGLFIPAAGLAAVALSGMGLRSPFRRLATAALFALALPTNVLIVLGGISAVGANDARLTVSVAELEAFDWLRDNAPSGSLVLASPESGLRLPAYAQVRVVYGHPFETVEATVRRAEVIDFYSGDWRLDYLERISVDYVLYGPREKSLGPEPNLPGWHLVFEQGVLIRIWMHP